MRITCGRYKGKNLKMPKGIRPTQEKVRQALFNILGDLEGLVFLELYAGSGAIGLEALSRGVRELTLVESHRDCQIAIKKNIQALQAKSCRVYPKDSIKVVKEFSQQKTRFDIIFMDPPYHKGSAPRLCPSTAPFGYAQDSLRSLGTPVGRSGPKVRDGDSLAKKTLQALGLYDILADTGLVIVQHFKKENLPEHLGVLHLIKQSTYGDTVLSFYKRKEAQ